MGRSCPATAGPLGLVEGHVAASASVNGEADREDGPVTVGDGSADSLLVGVTCAQPPSVRPKSRRAVGILMSTASSSDRKLLGDHTPAGCTGFPTATEIPALVLSMDAERGRGTNTQLGKVCTTTPWPWTSVERMTRQRFPHPPRWLAALVLLTALLTGCLPVADDPGAREKVIEMLRAGQLATVEDWRKDYIYLLPPDLDHVSQGGEIAVERLGDSLVVVFFDFRGLNHYTGWVYSSVAAPVEDPLGNVPFSAVEVAPHWYRVDAG
jgi:hypothetical protein